VYLSFGGMLTPELVVKREGSGRCDFDGVALDLVIVPITDLDVWRSARSMKRWK